MLSISTSANGHPLSIYARALAGRATEIEPGVWFAPHVGWHREPAVYREDLEAYFGGNESTWETRRTAHTWRDEQATNSQGGLKTWLKSMQRQTSGIDIPPSGDRRQVQGDKSNFEILYLEGRMPEIARRVFEQSAKTWANAFESNVTIRVHVDWIQLDVDTLGEAMTTDWVSGERHPKLRSDAYYSSAMAAAVSGKDFSSSARGHIHMRFNSPKPWHFDTSEDAPNRKWDLATVALHELAHGLFFTGTIQVRGQNRADYQDGFASRFDQFIAVTAGGSWSKSCSNTERLGALTEEGLMFTDRGTNISLFAPPEYKQGSSTYHLDDSRFRGDCERSGIPEEKCSDLMTPLLPDGYTQSMIGENTLRILNVMKSNAEGVPGGSCRLGTGNAAPRDPEEGFNFGKFQLPEWGMYTLIGVGCVGVIAIVASIATCFKKSPPPQRQRRRRRRRRRQQETPDEVI